MLPTIYLDSISSGLLRAGLRIYFVIVLLLVACFGDRCLHLRTKWRLLRGQQVQVTSMTGWLRGPSFMKAAMQMRRVPGGFLGFFMIGSAVLALLSDLAVSGFVKTVYRQTRCEFTRGLRIGSKNSTKAMYPSNIGSSALWATSAQVTSLFNDGYMGIYYKTSNVTNFAAEFEDLAGQWLCSPGQTINYNVQQYNDDAITTDLISRNIIFDTYWTYNNVSDPKNPDLSTQLVIMSADTIGGSDNPNFIGSETGPFSVHFAVDKEDAPGIKQMQAYDCELTDNTPDGTVKSILSTIDVPESFQKWVGSIQGKLWDGFDSKTSNDPPLLLEWMLNAMVMVSGSVNSIYWDVSQVTFPDQGCLMPYTAVPWPVTLCFGLATALGISLGLYMLYLFIAVHTESRRYDRGNSYITTPGGTPVSSKEIRHSTPNGLLDWMKHAVHESGTTEKKPSTHHLSKWLFSTRHHGGRRLGIVSKHMSTSSVNQYFGSPQDSSSDSNLISPPTPQVPGLFGYPSPQGSSYFPVLRKPVPSADYNPYQQVPKHDYEIGNMQIRPSP